MSDLIVGALKVVAPFSVALIVLAQGMGIAPRQVADYFSERPWVMLRSLVAVLVLVPLAALGLVLTLEPRPGLAIGLAILVACPPAPLMIRAAPKVGGGNAAFMASLHLSLAVLAFLTVPVVLYLLSVPLGFEAAVDLRAMAWILARTILVPIGLGLAIRGLFPELADKLGPTLAKAGSIGMRVVVVLALAALYPALLDTDLWSYFVIAVVSAAALTIGHLHGAADPHAKTTLAVECAVRHPVLALTIATSNFSPQQALPVLVPCVVTFILVAMAYLVWRGRSS